MSDPIITVEKLSKCYLVGHQSNARSRYVALRDVIAKNAREFVRKAADLARGRQIIQGDEVEEFWALKDASFEVHEGEVLGIIGPNGAGKSTLLKILSRITDPTEGRIVLRGRVASLLEVGTGFHPELTGRENIFLNGAILGMSQWEIRKKFDDIVQFAEVDRFLDTPVKRYSSGMYVRLAFAVAAHLEPEILVVDEVLAVGDAEFQKKCLGKMSQVARGGRTVIFVSHNLAAVEALCSSCIGLDHGHIFKEGSPIEVINTYLSAAQASQAIGDLANITRRQGRGDVRFARISLADGSGRIINRAKTGQDLEIRLEFSGNDVIARSARVSLDLFAKSSGQKLFVCDTGTTYLGEVKIGSGSTIRCIVPKLPLSGGTYHLGLFLERAEVIEDWIQDDLILEVDDGDFFGSGRNTPRGHEGRVVLVKHSWYFPTQTERTLSVGEV